MGTGISLGIGIPFRRRAGGLSPEAKAWEARIIANGGTIPAATLAIFDQYFFIPAKANGNILTELDRLNIYCGLNGYEIAARTNLIKSAHYVTPVSSPTFDNNGYKSSGTSYLDLNYNPSTQGVKLTQNSAIDFIVLKNPTYSGSIRSLGATSNASVRRLEIFLRVAGLIQTLTNAASSTTSNETPSGYAHILGFRNNSANQSTIVNGVVNNTAVVSSLLPNANVFELTSNNAGTPAGDYDTNYHLASGHSSASIDYAALRTILNNLFTALGV